jgi:hypothetical protein
VLVRQLACHVVAHHRHRIDTSSRGERILGEVLSRLLRVVVDEVDCPLPHGGEAPGDVGAVLDEVAGDGAAGREALPFSSSRMYLAITPASSVRATPSLRMVEACGSSV